MKTAVIQATSQAAKNEFLYRSVCESAKGWDVINFGCTPEDTINYSYIDISLQIGLLIGSGAVDFVVTGCSSGQGMMLACNSMPGVLCGYTPTPKDAFLFAQINNGNAVSLPLGEEYTWAGEENCRKTLQALFSKPFGGGYPEKDAERKKRDAVQLKAIRAGLQPAPEMLPERVDIQLIRKALACERVINYILKYGTNADYIDRLAKLL